MGWIETIALLLIVVLVVATAFAAPVESKAYFKALFTTGGKLIAKGFKMFNHKDNNTVESSGG